MQTFASLGLSAPMLDALQRAGYQAPTPVQAGAIVPAMEGRNVIGCAATGTGKTAAFMLPLLERAAGTKGSRALVLSPTRELAQQTYEYIDTFGPAHRLGGALVVGGLGMGPQVAALRQGRAVIVATPGRLIDHIEQGTADLSRIETLVLDEADRMLDMGFRPQLERILSRLRARKQTLLFSATMAGEVREFADRHVPNPVQVEIHRSGTTAARAEQRLYEVARHEKIAMLLTLLYESDERTLVFVRTKHRADKIATVVGRAGHNAARIHGGRSQSQRKHALAGFKDGRYRVLIATDVAARGIDVDDIGHVINLDLPMEPEDYVHRIGRTARNMASGVASSFAEPSDRQAVLAIERLIKQRLPRETVPREHPVFSEEAERRKRPAPQGGAAPAGEAAAGRRPPKRSEDSQGSGDGGGRAPQRRQERGPARAAAGGPAERQQRRERRAPSPRAWDRQPRREGDGPKAAGSPRGAKPRPGPGRASGPGKAGAPPRRRASAGPGGRPSGSAGRGRGRH